MPNLRYVNGVDGLADLRSCCGKTAVPVGYECGGGYWPSEGADDGVAKVLERGFMFWVAGSDVDGVDEARWSVGLVGMDVQTGPGESDPYEGGYAVVGGYVLHLVQVLGASSFKLLDGGLCYAVDTGAGWRR